MESGGVDCEEGDLVDFGSEESELGVGGGEREASVAGGQLVRLVLVVEEGVSGRECDPKTEPVPPLNLGVRAWLVHIVRVGRFHNHHH